MSLDRKADVSALALEATLTAIKGAGWSTETLKLIKDTIDSLHNLAITDILSDSTAFAGASIALIKTETDKIAAIKTKTDTLPTDPADESLLEAEFDRKIVSMDFWSTKAATVTLTTGGTDVDLPNVVISGLPSGFTLVKVLIYLFCRAIEDTSGVANAISGAQNIRIKKSTGAWGTDDVVAIALTDNQWTVVASTKEAGDVEATDDANDCKSEVDGNATYNLRFENATVDGNNLVLHDVRVMLRAWFY